MKAKSLIVLLLAGIWGVGSWWWYTCKVKGFCEVDTTAAQMASGTAATGVTALASADADQTNQGGAQTGADEADKADAGQAKADADKADAEQAKADADKVDAEQAKTDADNAAAEQAKADADKAATEQTQTGDADKAATEQAKADADNAAAEQAKADADNAAAEQAKADADNAAAEQAKADADKAAVEQAKADADKVTMETDSTTQGSDIGPATLTFPTGSANPKLADSTQAYFEKVAQFLKDNSSATVTIVGHTDSQGNPARNKALGLKRAEMLQKTLVDLGAPKDRVTASSQGADQPIADNNTEEGRKKNRRVVITPAK
ncbi:MAG: OmpA family protein [Thiothrix litoralis]|uniref:OmpA family protein n=1 Tax=Thiothrix litoralis TaxID=2891210 RepID=UPI003C7754DF